jgi:hypothetical protein
MGRMNSEYLMPGWGYYAIQCDREAGIITEREQTIAILGALATTIGANTIMATHFNMGSPMFVAGLQSFSQTAPPVAAAAGLVGAVTGLSLGYEKKVMSKARGKSNLNVTPFGGQGFGPVV